MSVDSNYISLRVKNRWRVGQLGTGHLNTNVVESYRSCLFPEANTYSVTLVNKIAVYFFQASVAIT